MCCGGVGKCMCILLGLVRLDLGVGGDLDGDGEEVITPPCSNAVTCLNQFCYFVFKGVNFHVLFFAF